VGVGSAATTAAEQQNDWREEEHEPAMDAQDPDYGAEVKGHRAFPMQMQFALAGNLRIACSSLSYRNALFNTTASPLNSSQLVRTAIAVLHLTSLYALACAN
jgi:hypothetical protein